MVHPRTRLIAGAAALGLAALAVRREDVGACERRAFRALNELPGCHEAPVWIGMQVGNLAAAPVAAVAAAATGHRRAARLLLTSGVTTWVLSKVVKRAVRRPRPTVILPEARRRGREQSGSGFVSGHAAVAASLCAAALPELPPRYRDAAAAAALFVGAARVYVGAHLPLDVVGGAGLGIAVEAAVELATGGHGCHGEKR
jgi:membrane-associated phospholipid phosphatase